MSVGIKIKVEYHREGCFYTVRGKRLKDLKSLRDMTERIMSINNVKWAWHIVLTFNPESLNYWFKLYKDAGKGLSKYFDKIRKIFWGVKYFWKYEEGTKVWCKPCNRKVDFTYDLKNSGWVHCNNCKSHIKSDGELPHYHLIYDFVNMGIRSKQSKIEEKLKKIRKVKIKRTEMTTSSKERVFLLEWKEKTLSETDWKKLIYPHNWAKFNWKKWFKDQKQYSNNKNKTDLELLVGYYHYKKWGFQGGKRKKDGKSTFNPNGIVHARKLRGYYDLKNYVKKDFFKFTESKWLGKSKKKWGHSQNLISGGKKAAKDWEQVLETIGYYNYDKALKMVIETKDMMIDYYDEKGLKGVYVFKRVIDDLNDMKVVQIGGIVITKPKEKIQGLINVKVIGQTKCKYCEKMFEIGRGYIGLYCSIKCFNAYGKSIANYFEQKGIERKKNEKKGWLKKNEKDEQKDT